MGALATFRGWFRKQAPAPPQDSGAVSVEHLGTIHPPGLEHAGGFTAQPPGVGKRVLQTSIDPFTAGFDQGNDTPIVRLMKKFPGYIRIDVPNGLAHQLSMVTFHVMRKSIPALDTAILKRRFLEGSIVAVSQDEVLARDINDWIQNVEVGYTPDHPTTGLQLWIDACGEFADEVGESFPEIRLSENGREIERLLVPDSRLFEFKKESVDDEDWFLFHRMHQGRGVERVESPMLRTFHFTPSPTSPWGRPLASGLEFTGEVFIRLMISLNNLVWRMGDPSKIWKLLYDKDAEIGEGDDEEDITLLMQTINSAYKARNRGETVDVFYGVQGAQLESEALGENLLVSSMAPYFRDLLALMSAQVIGKADVPSWLYPAGIVPSEGLNSDRSQMEGTVAQVAADQRAAQLDRIARWGVNTFLILQKSARFVGKYTLVRESISPINEKMRQEARGERSEADSNFILSAVELENIGALKNEELPQYLREREVIT